jgi:RHS repeat-associated protein
MEAWAKYENKTQYSRENIVGAMASILGNNFVGTAGGIDVISNATQVFQNGISLAVGAPFPGNGNEDDDTPHAYLYYLLFDRNFTPITAGWSRVTTNGGFDEQNAAFSTHEKLMIPTVTITEPGYIYVFVSNESEDTKVWFDDVKVTHQRSTIVAGADYYPFGLVMEDREITREDYRYGYQGQFSEEDSETGWNAFELRMYDSRLGRWLNVDPYGQFPSPYLGMGNDPVMSIDPDGGFCCGGRVAGSIAGSARGIGSASATSGLPKLLSTVTVTAPRITMSRFVSALTTGAVRTLAFVNGAVNAYNSNISIGLVTLDDPNNHANSYDYANGQQAGHIISLAQGIYETGMGVVTVTGGGAVSLTGAGAVVGVPAIAVGTTGIVHGGGMTINAWNNLGKVHHVNMSGSSSAAEGHHLLPQQFKPQFERAGLDIEKFKIPLDKAKHRLKPDGVHTKGGGNWNKRWEEFFDKYPNANKKQILEFLDKLRLEFGI